jgi:hypothetical protein
MGTHEVIAVMEEAFGGMDLPACISLVDSDGLVIYNIGSCDDQLILESLNAYLIMSFEKTMEQLIVLSEVLDSLVINTGNKVFYVDDLRGGQNMFIIVQTSPELMNRVLPFLKSVVSTIESALGGFKSK